MSNGQVSKLLKYSHDENGKLVVADLKDAPKEQQEMSDQQHGSFVAQGIASNGAANTTVGIAYGVADIYAAQVLSSSSGDINPIIGYEAMLDLQKKYGVNIFNASWGGGDVSQPAIPMIKEIINNGGLIVYAAGNGRQAQPMADNLIPNQNPELEKGILTVVGLNREHTGLYDGGAAKGGSNHCGDAQRWCLAGDYINGVFLGSDNGYYETYGTSGAAPKIAATAALVSSKYSWMTVDQLRQTLLTTATYMDDGSGADKLFNSTYGWGYYNKDAALKGVGMFSSIFGKYFQASLPQGYVSEFGNDISGDGGLEKTGLGTLILSGKNTYTGDTLVKEGDLFVTGKLKSNLTVSQNGFLGGNGELASLTNNGVIKTEYGSMLIDGDFKQSNTGTYVYSLNYPLTVNGTAAVDGSLVVYTKQRDMLVKGEHTVLSAKGGLTGQFANYSSLSSFMKVTGMSYDANNAKVTIDYNDATTLGSAQQVALNQATGDLTNKLMEKANAEYLGTGTNTALTSYVAGLQATTSQAKTQAILSSNSGAIFAESPSVLLHNQAIVSNQVANRTAAVTAESGGVWATTGYMDNDLDANGWNTVNSKVYLNTIGLDTVFGDKNQYVLGGFLTNYIDHSRYDELDGKSNTNATGAGLYTKVNTDSGVYVSANAQYIDGDTKFERNIANGGAGQYSQTKGDVNSLGLYAETGYKVGIDSLWSLTPYLGYGYNKAKMDAVKEDVDTGLAVNDVEVSESRINFGLRTDYMLSASLVFGAFVEYAKAIDRNLPDVTITSNLANVSTTYEAPSFNKDYFFYGVGLSYGNESSRFTAFGNVSSQGNGDSNIQAQLGLKYKF